MAEQERAQPVAVLPQYQTDRSSQSTSSAPAVRYLTDRSTVQVTTQTSVTGKT